LIGLAVVRHLRHRHPQLGPTCCCRVAILTMTENKQTITPGELRQVLIALPKSSETECPYFTDRSSSSAGFMADDEIDAGVQDIAINMGFRRCGDLWYRASCPNCDMCISYRVNVDKFALSNNQKKILRRNRDVSCTVVVPDCTSEKEDIYIRYQHSQHYLRPPFSKSANSKEFSPSEALETMNCQMYTNPGTTREVQMRIGETLVGFGTMDIAVTTTSLVYFVFDPEHQRRSLGTFNILWSIGWARGQGFEHVNLGYYIPNHAKMDYKSRFKPAEKLDRVTDQWDGFVEE
jgi:arginine-tRNA-protein transferase